MTNSLKRLLALLLCAVMLLAAASGCTPAQTGGEESSTAPDAGSIDIDLTQYKIIRPVEMATTTLNEVVNFRKTLNNIYGTSFKIEDDFLKGEETDAIKNALEILLGHTTRSASSEALEAVSDPTAFVIKLTPTKIVINSETDIGLISGMNYFLDMVGEGKLSLPENYLYTAGSSDVIQVMVNGTNTLSVVYKDGLDNTTNASDDKDRVDLEVLYAKAIREKIAKITGSNPNIATDWIAPNKDSSVGNEILVGQTDRAESAEFLDSIALNEYGYAVIGNKVVVAGHNLTTLELAYNAFMNYLDSSGSVSADGSKNLYFVRGTRFTASSSEWYVDFPKPDGGTYAGSSDAGNNCLELYYTGADENIFKAYQKKLEDSGYTLSVSNSNPGVISAGYQSKDCMLYTYYVPFEKSVRIIACAAGKNNFQLYPTAESVPAYTKIADGKVTQMTLNYSAGNFGMCYIITLADGSFVVFDGGGYSADYGDENRLYKLLKSLNKRTDGKITVAAWILTHDHWDHFTNFFNCVKKYGSEFKIEACYLNMPSKNATYNTRNPNYYFNNNFSTLSYTVGGTKYVKLHTGMKFYVRNAEFEVLFTQEDVFPDRINYFNESTTVLRMKLDGNTFMWNGDAKNWASKGIVSRYGSYVKSDICQVAHHGYDGMTQALYQTVDPFLLFWPTSNSNWTSQITGKTYAVDKYLYEKLGAENIIVAEPTKSIMLPYHKGDPIIVEAN